MPIGSWCKAEFRKLKPEYMPYKREISRFSRKEWLSPWQQDQIYEEWKLLSIRRNILLNSGRDFLHNQGYITASVGTAVLQYIALSTDSGAPNATDTTLTSEVASSGLARAAATTDSHTAGTNTTTIAYTWTASGTVNSIQKCALFTASSGGTMANETTFSVTNMNATDQLTLTYTITLG